MNIWNRIKFVVSCQALKNEPMFGRGVVLKFVDAVVAGGANAVRLSQIDNIKQVQKKYPQLPIIGIIKKDYPNSSVFITPTLKELKLLVATDVSIIAIDATNRKRPKQDLKSLVDWFKTNKKPNQYLMADCASIDDVKKAINLKFDFIGTTLRGYTEDTKNQSNTANDFAFIKACSILCKKAKIQLVAEGGLNDPVSVKQAWKAGAKIVVVGSAITRPKFITEQFFKEFAKP